MAKVHAVKKARKDYPEAGIKRGDTYYWWQFLHSAPTRSKSYPKQSQLTRSAHKSEAYSIVEEIEMFSTGDIISNGEGLVGDLVDRIRELAQQSQDSLDNMPEQLQEGDTGQLLQQRVEDMEQWADELDGIDCHIDADELKSEAEEEAEDELQDDPDLDVENRIEELYDEKVEYRAEEILQEIQGCEPNIE